MEWFVCPEGQTLALFDKIYSVDKRLNNPTDRLHSKMINTTSPRGINNYKSLKVFPIFIKRPHAIT